MVFNIEKNILYLDNHLLVLNKPAGLLVQGDHTGDDTLLEMGKTYLKSAFSKPGNVYLGIVQRLDRPVSGVVVFARTSKAASRLSAMIREHDFQKSYWALVHGTTATSATLSDYIVRDGVRSMITDSEHGKHAKLEYRRLAVHDNVSWVEIDLLTGRHHQIRVQFAHQGHPVLGDFRYGSKTRFGNKALALHARHLSFKHPVKDDVIKFTADPGPDWPSYIFKE